MNQIDDGCEIPRWVLLKEKLNNLSFEEFVLRMQQDEKSILIDARTPQEFSMHRLAGARNLDYLGENFLDEFESLDKEKTYFVYCNSGRRSVRIGIMMMHSGFNKIYNLDLGIRGNQEAFPEVFSKII